MRVLFLTAYMNPSNLRSSSTVFGYGEIAKELVRRGHLVYWYVPRNVIANRDFPDELLDNPMIKLIETDVVFDQYYEDCNLPSDIIDLFHQSHGKYQIDAVVTSKLNLVSTLRMMLNHLHDGKCPEIKFYGLEIFPKFRSITPIVPQSFEEARAAGWRACSRVYWGNPVDMRTGCDIVYRVFSASDSAKLRKKSYAFGTNGVPIKRLESATDCTMESVNLKGRVDRVQFFGRPWGEIDEFEDAISVYEAGLKCEFLLSLPGGSRFSKHVPLNKFGPALRVMENVSRETFYRFLKTSKVGVNIQKAGNFPTMHMEALYAGVVLVMPPIYWWVSFWPDYPFIYKSKIELMSLVKFILADYEGALKMIQPYRERIKKEFDSTEFARILVNDLEADFDPAVVPSSDLRAILEGLPSSFSFEQAARKLKKETRIALEVGENPKEASRSLAYFHPRAWLRGMLLQMGFKEVADIEELKYEK